MLLQKPDRDEWGSGVEAMQCALQLEKNVNQALLDLHKIASEKGDPHVSVYRQSIRISDLLYLLMSFTLV